MAKKIEYIEDVPEFESLYAVRSQIDELIRSLTALTQGHDVAQRATDLVGTVDELRDSIYKMVTIQD
jgi:hypothetical protein